MYDILVVWAGPAGASAALFAEKAGLKTKPGTERALKQL